MPNARTGEIEYKRVRLGDICRIKTGNTNAEDAVEGGAYPLFDRSSVIKRSDKFLFDAEAVIIPGEGKEFSPRYFSGKFDLHQRAYALTALTGSINVKYLYYSILQNKAYLAKAATGSTVKSLRLPIIANMEVSLPPLTEQKRIASILSAYDDLIENNTRRIKILEEAAQALYREWFVDFKFPGYEKAKFIDSHTEYGKIPEGWEVKRLGDLVRIKKQSVNPAALDPDTPYVGIEHISKKSLALTDWSRAADAGSNKLRFKRGDVLFGNIRPYFHKVCVAPVDGICSSDIVVLEAVKPEYFGPALMTVFSDKFIASAVASSKGTKMPRADWSVLLGHPMIWPKVFNTRLAAQFLSLFEGCRAYVAIGRSLSSRRDAMLRCLRQRII